MTPKPDYHAMLRVAIDEARRGLAEGGIPIGAAIFTRDGELLGAGRNRRIQENDPSVHAETDAFRKAGRQRSYRDTVMATTLAPCWYCSGLVRQFGIGTVVVGESVNFPGGVEWLRENGVEVVDLGSRECAQMLADYIHRNPEVWNEDIGQVVRQARQPASAAAVGAMKRAPTPSEFLVISRGQWDEDASREQIQDAIDRFYAWHDRLVAEGKMKPGQRLSIEGRRVSRDGVTDGPFTEAKEVIGGYWHILAGSLDEAARIAAGNPCLAFGLVFEVRPIDPVRASAFAVTNETPRERGDGPPGTAR